MSRITVISVSCGNILDEIKINDKETSISFIVDGDSGNIKYNIVKNNANCIIDYKNCSDNNGMIITVKNTNPMLYIFNSKKKHIVFRVSV